MAMPKADQNPIVLKNVSQILGKDHENFNNTNVPTLSIFKVPNSLSESKPEAYAPRLVGLGAYNHFRPELQQMQTFKLAVVKKIRSQFPKNEDFDSLVRLLKLIGVPRFARACYAAYLDMDDETLACLLAIDGLYLFELLRHCVDSNYNKKAGPGFFRDLVGFAGGGKSPRDIAAQDAIMLENQIPILSLKLILTVEQWYEISGGDKHSLSIVTKLLPELLLDFAKELSPLDVLNDYPLSKVLQHSHLLDLLYSLVTLKTSPEDTPKEDEKEARFVQEIAQEVAKEVRPTMSWAEEVTIGSAQEVVEEDIVLPICSGEGQILGQILCLAAHTTAGEVAAPIWKLLLDTVLLPFKIPIELIQGLIELPWSKIWLFDVHGCAVSEQPEEEILIPRALELCKTGVTFCPVVSIADIRFEQQTRSFHLPSIKLHINSEVVLRNLIAYEAAVKWEPDLLVLARYMELMSGLVKSIEDVQLLEGTIIEQSSSLKGHEIVDLFAGMSKPIRYTKMPHIDEAIAEVNRYYNGLGTVLVFKFIKKWGLITFRTCSVFVVLLLLLALIVGVISLLDEWFCNRNTSGTQLRGLRVLKLRSYA